ncbi:MAG: hypothetical protein JO283_12280 [Bradyrhizobium sp.]|nr:hypothetical protein [Bradyrhizobium sp.]
MDCGFYQGSREMEQANRDFGFDPVNIDVFLLTTRPSRSLRPHSLARS